MFICCRLSHLLLPCISGFSTVLQHDIHGEGARWTQISLQKPNGTSFGQFQGEAKYITGGRLVLSAFNKNDFCQIGFSNYKF